MPAIRRIELTIVRAMLKDTAIKPNTTGSIKLFTKVYQYLPWINRLIDERITDVPVSNFNISDSARLYLKNTTTKRPTTTTKIPEVIKSTSAFCSKQYTLVTCPGSTKVRNIWFLSPLVLSK